MKMERKRSSKIFLQRSKREIVDKARKGIFDGNPLLAAPHRLVCKACGCIRKITYLSYLKSGRFDLGQTRMMEVVYAAPTLTGLSDTMEAATPIVFRVKCRRCRTEMLCSPVSLEYLLFTAGREQKLEQMYV